MSRHRPAPAYKVGPYVPGHGYPIVSLVTGRTIGHCYRRPVALRHARERTVAFHRAVA